MPSTEEIIEAAYKAYPYDKEGTPDSHSYSFAQGAEFIKSHIKAQYSEEFIKWCIKNIAYTFPKGRYVEIESNTEFDTIDEILKYWLDIQK